MSVSIFKGSILQCKVDAIVNPANSFLNHAGGLAGVINACARGDTHNAFIREDWPSHTTVAEFRYELAPALKKYDAFAPGLVPVGGAVLGPPGALCRRFKAIIHAVGPIWGGGDLYESALVGRAYHNSLCRAEEADFDSIAFPAISAGIFGVPIGVVARNAMTMARSTTLDVTFALMDDTHIACFENAAIAAGVRLA